MNFYHTKSRMVMPALLVAFGGLLFFLSCSKKATDYRSFLDGQELIYPGKVTNVQVAPGDGRLMLSWHPSPDPSVTKYVVYWNNYADSLVITANSHSPSDTVTCIVDNLDEYAYSFFLVSFDDEGNKSITTEITNARSYGDYYKSTLHNRLPDAGTPYVVNDDGSVTLYFDTPDTINVTTTIQYTNAAGEPAEASIGADETSVTLPGYLSGEPVVYQSSYIPVMNAIDTFYTAAADTFPDIFRLVQCDKALFSEMDLPYDMGIYQSDTRVSKLWDGSVGPQSYPNIYHSNDASGGMPGTFSFDMGKVYESLNYLEETGRNCCNNPNNFEIWGIADTTGAIPDIDCHDANWKSTMTSLGWTLLTEAYRSDDGNALMKFDFVADPPPVRFIRVRILSTTTNASATNISELTFYNKE